MGKKTREEIDIEEADLRKLIQTPQFDPRFPNQNQSQNCFINYVDHYRCMDLFRGRNEEQCEAFKKIFTAICPNDWITRWDDLRDKGIFPQPIVRVPNPKYEPGNEKDCN